MKFSCYIPHKLFPILHDFKYEEFWLIELPSLLIEKTKFVWKYWLGNKLFWRSMVLFFLFSQLWTNKLKWCTLIKWHKFVNVQVRDLYKQIGFMNSQVRFLFLWISSGQWTEENFEDFERLWSLGVIFVFGKFVKICI